MVDTGTGIALPIPVKTKTNTTKARLFSNGINRAMFAPCTHPDTIELSDGIKVCTVCEKVIKP